MYGRILVPVDGSATAEAGLRHAVGLAAEQNAQVRVLNVVDHRALAPVLGAYALADVNSLIDSMRAQGGATLRQAEALARTQHAKVETAMIDAQGRDVSDVILQDAGDWDADLIVMGTHGRRGLNRLLLGSDAERVLREARVPVLLVRTQGDPRSEAARGSAELA